MRTYKGLLDQELTSPPYPVCTKTNHQVIRYQVTVLCQVTIRKSLDPELTALKRLSSTREQHLAGTWPSDTVNTFAHLSSTQLIRQGGKVGCSWDVYLVTTTTGRNYHMTRKCIFIGHQLIMWPFLMERNRRFFSWIFVAVHLRAS